MPRLVLLEDDGRELFSGKISRQNVEMLGAFIRRNMPALRAAASYKRAIDAAGELFGAFFGSPPQQPRQARGRAAATRVIYEPPRPQRRARR